MNEGASKKISSPGAAGAVIIFFALLFVFSKWGPAIPFSVLSQSRGEPMVVTGEGKATAIPDIAKVSAGIQDSGTSLTQVQNSVNKKSQTLVDSLKKLGIEEKDIKTSSYNIAPQQDYQADPPRITGYQVSVNYQVTVRDIDKVNDVLTTVTAAGANLIGGVSFDLSDGAKLKAMDVARQDAVAQAKENAKSLAKASGVTLGKIINVSETTNGQPRPLALPVSAGGIAEKSAIQPDIQPGEAEIDLTVTLSYEVR